MITEGRKRICLALGGGVARGPAHLGVLTVFEREGIVIDCIAGSSAGALVGALYCAGIKPAEAVTLMSEFGWRRIARPVWPRRGFVSFANLEHWLIRIIGDITFADLSRPLAVVATDLNLGRPVTFRTGRVAPVVHASCAVPGFVEPVELDGKLLGDGGASANLPVRAAREMGAEIVIGVDLFQPQIRSSWGPFGIGFASIEHFIRQSGGGLEAVDCLITPALAGASYVRFDLGPEMVAAGQRAAEAQLPAILALMENRIATA